MKLKQIALLISCVWLWTTAVQAQQISYTGLSGDLAKITVNEIGDSVGLEKEMRAAFDSLADKAGIMIDLRRMETEQKAYNQGLAAAIAKAYEGYGKPMVVLIAVRLRWETDLGVWMKDKEWVRFESSNDHEKAEAKLKILVGRHMKEGQERMDWLMKQEKKR